MNRIEEQRLKKDIFEFLDRLRESGEINMFGAGIYIQGSFNINKESANKYLSMWMKEFGKV